MINCKHLPGLHTQPRYVKTHPIDVLQHLDTAQYKTLCSGSCTLTLGLHTMTKNCNETLTKDSLGINMSSGLSYPNSKQFTAQVSSLTFVCNKANCNANVSIIEVIAIANAFLTAQSNGIRMKVIINRIYLIIVSFCLYH
ncbi:unnamed protein product [Adineta ricciae]|uniref:Uncharacterized protein n=1 Tax=Adineta ricciae TaxID=249248 RepID=A0A815Z0H4_ADIRI|nr:unnamed protein product [Adineta ricciae]